MTEDDLFDNRALGRLAHFEDCQSAIDQMFAEAFASKGNEAFDDFLRFVIRFSNLSVYNATISLWLSVTEGGPIRPAQDTRPSNPRAVAAKARRRCGMRGILEAGLCRAHHRHPP